ncbi:MAG: glycosyltransferase family 2 protein [Anaerolineaceae bacterium]|jgi:dolichol-phosphate mannosyltransferase|nr:glycosyltransferase family 2 protein [Anaerolineaceae bacterium]
MISVDIIVPFFNEEDAILPFFEQLQSAVSPLPYEFHLIFINDGSKDNTQQHLQALAHAHAAVTIVELSRNFGHQAALTAGLDQSHSDYAISMDGDGQHPPEMIAEMLRLAESGYDIVLTERISETRKFSFKQTTSAAFYRLINFIGNTHIQPGGADFRLLSRQVVEELQAMPEYHRFLRGMVAWVGFKSIILPFQPPERLAGESKYSLRKMLNLGMDAVFSFSMVPIYISLVIGLLFLLGALAEMIYVLNFWIRGDIANLAPGWSSLMFILLTTGGSLMITQAVSGLYIGYMFQEAKGRPVYIVKGISKTT